MTCFPWQYYQKNWENQLEVHYNEVLMETGMSYERLLEIIQILQKYDVIPNE